MPTMKLTEREKTFLYAMHYTASGASQSGSEVMSLVSALMADLARGDLAGAARTLEFLKFQPQEENR